MNNNIFAILNPEQIDNLCKRFNISKEELTPVFSGWHKRILIANDKVFLFPREPQFQRGVDIESSIYHEFSQIDAVALPQLIEKVIDPEISGFPFIVTTKLEGKPFSEFIDDISIEDLELFLLELTNLIVKWHSIPQDMISSLIKTRFREQESVMNLSTILDYLSVPDRYKEAISFVLNELNDYIIFTKTEIEAISQVVARVSSLSYTLVHGDIHEDQILVEKKESNLRITGILDWESARFANPIQEFNFGEWGLQIWKFKNSFAQLRRSIWNAYCKARNIENYNENDLHIFYLFCELAWMLEQKERPVLGMTGKSFQDSIQEQIADLKSFLR